jgi:hypothetical protein
LRLPAFDEVESRRERFQKPLHLNGESFVLQEHAIYQPFVDRVTITGPLGAASAGDSPSRRRIFVCRPATAAQESSCAAKILSALAQRAYRRPVTAADTDRLMGFYRQGRSDGDFDAGIELAIRRLLVDPDFLFRIERDPASIRPNSVYRISDLELASRLSFFLWSSIPDEELLSLAVRGRLRDPSTLQGQVSRLLADPRADAFVTNFAGQWLQLRNLDAAQPTGSLFPDFDGALRQAFRRETELFFTSILRENRSVLEFLDADYTFVNERLAKHYGIPNVYGSHFRRVPVTAAERRGLLGQGSILTITSRPNRTSPVLRGKWILDTLLASPPPDPPPVVPPLAEVEEGSKQVLTMRERMAKHRSNPVCSSCHSMIDPVGFALEQFDPVGRWREFDEASQRIDPSGTLPNGAKFGDLGEFKRALLSKPEMFAAALTEKLLTYALGRGLTSRDMPAVRRIVRDAAPARYRLSGLILGVVRSDPFAMRRAASGPAQESVRR